MNTYAKYLCVPIIPFLFLSSRSFPLFPYLTLFLVNSHFSKLQGGKNLWIILSSSLPMRIDSLYSAFSSLIAGYRPRPYLPSFVK